MIVKRVWNSSTWLRNAIPNCLPSGSGPSRDHCT